MIASNPPVPPDSDPMTATADHIGRGGWLTSIALGAIVLGVYMANRREISSTDTVPTLMVAVALAQGDGIYLDRLYYAWAADPLGDPPYILARRRRHLVSRYPIAPALLAWPLLAPQIAYLDRIAPGWELDYAAYWAIAPVRSKRAMALMAAFTTVLLHRVIRGIGLTRVAIPATLGVSLGSTLWSVASQGLWQHGPAALALTLAIWLLLPREASRGRLFLAGLAAAALVACRPVDVVFAAAILGRVAWLQPRRLGWFLPGPIVGAILLVGSNLWLFGDAAGGLAELEAMHPQIHAAPAGPWSGNLLDGLAGTLFSPSRGLLTYIPWIGLALAILPFSAGRLARSSIVAWLLASLVPYGLLLSKYTVWWGGHCFGPRYWTDAMPLFALILAAGLDWSWRHRPLVLAGFAATILAAVAVEVIGTFYSPSSWNTTPADVDRHHERLWDWRDNELTRCLKEGPARLR